jgi:glycosyltransferase involved in cell wall biosynthesis
MTSDISVVIPAYGQCPHLPDVIDAILSQSIQPKEIVVAHSGCFDPTGALAAKSGLIRVFHSDRRLLAGAARNLGAQHARGRWLAFLDADAKPTRTWLERLIEAAGDRDDRLLIGSIGFEVSGGYWGLCLWVTEFSAIHPGLPDGEKVDGASANMMVPAAAFRRCGGFPTKFQPGEDTVLYARLREAGLTQLFCAAAEARHYNPAGIRHFLGHQYKLGLWSAVCRRVLPLRGHLAARFWPLAPALWLGRLYLIVTRLWRKGAIELLKALLLLPGIVLGLLVWNVGFIKGLQTELSGLFDPANSMIPTDEQVS